MSQWLLENFHNLKLDQEIEDYGWFRYTVSFRSLILFTDGLAHRNFIDSINVVDYSGVTTEAPFFPLKDVELDVQAYEMHENRGSHGAKPKERPEDSDDEDGTLQARVTCLPSKALDGVWDS